MLPDVAEILASWLGLTEPYDLEGAVRIVALASLPALALFLPGRLVRLAAAAIAQHLDDDDGWSIACCWSAPGMAACWVAAVALLAVVSAPMLGAALQTRGR